MLNAILLVGVFTTLGLFAFSYGVHIPKVKAMEIKARVRCRQLEVDMMREYLTVDYLRLRWLEMTDEEREAFISRWGPPTWSKPTQETHILPGRSL